MNYILLLGGNIGDRQSFLKKAIEGIHTQCGNVVQKSRIYETEAWGLENQASFYNQVIEVQSELVPEIFLQTILSIEQELGRVRLIKWGERVIDIDILFIDQEQIDTKTLTVPHPHLHKRRFTLVPLLDLNADFVHPILEKTIAELLEECPDELEVKEVG